MRSITWAEVERRRIKIDDDAKTQSVNVCTPSNTEGAYEEVFYFTKDFRVTAEELNRYGDLALLRRDLRQRLYRQTVKYWES